MSSARASRHGQGSRWRSPLRRTLAGGAALLVLGAASAEATATPAGRTAPRGGTVSSFALPDGFQPEGIDIGLLGGRPYAYVASLADGSVYRADLTTGRGGVLTAPRGVASVGVEVDDRGRLFVAGGPGGVVNGDPGGSVQVYDADSGTLLADYQVSEGAALVNDVVVTDEAAWFTDTINPVLYKIPFGRNGELPAADGFEVLPLSGDYRYDQFASTVEGNGIEVTPDGRALIAIQYDTGRFFRIDPASGRSTEVDLGGETLPLGDGLTLDGDRLYVPQNTDTLAVVDLSRDGSSGRVVQRITDPGFDGPATVARSGQRLYLPAVRFTDPSPRTAQFTVTSVPVPPRTRP